MTFENLRIKRVIVHETLAGSDAERRPHQSQDITPLDAEIKDALQRRMVEALGDDSFSIQAEIEQEGDGSAFHTSGIEYRNEVASANFISIPLSSCSIG